MTFPRKRHADDAADAPGEGGAPPYSISHDLREQPLRARNGERFRSFSYYPPGSNPQGCSVNRLFPLLCCVLLSGVVLTAGAQTPPATRHDPQPPPEKDPAREAAQATQVDAGVPPPPSSPDAGAQDWNVNAPD